MRKNLSQAFEEFMFESEFIRKIRPETLRGYRNTFTLFVKLTPDVKLDSIDTTHIINFFRTLHERKRYVGKGVPKTGIRKSTVATYWSKLNTFFQWLVAKQYLLANPFTGLPYPTPSYEDRKFLSKNDIEKIITAIQTCHDNDPILLKRNLVIFYLLLFCGLRREELMSLQVRDIDFDKRTLLVRADASKSGRSRHMPLHSTTLMHLKDYLAARKAYTTQFLLVSSKRDDALTVDGLIHLINRLRDRAGFSFHLHQFRHTFAVNFLNSSKNIAKLKQLMGHKSIAMTLTYLRCLPVDELRGDIEVMSIDSLL